MVFVSLYVCAFLLFFQMSFFLCQKLFQVVIHRQNLRFTGYGALIKIHPDQVFPAVEALEQIALQMPAVDGFLNHFPLLIVPHGIVQHIVQHTQRPQFSGTHMAQIGTVVAAVGAPVFLLPTGVAGSSVDQLVQAGRVLYAIVYGAIVLEAAVIFPGRLAAGDTLRAQTLNILHSVKGACIHQTRPSASRSMGSSFSQ